MILLPLLLFGDQVALAEGRLLNKEIVPAVYQRLNVRANQVTWGKKGETGFTSHKWMLVHIWAVECVPCRKELPAMQKMLESFRVQGIHPVYVTETIARRDIEDFYKANPTFFAARADHYYGPDISTREYWEVTAQPLSLFVDGKTLQIKRAFVGSVVDRLDEVKAVARYIHAHGQVPAAPKEPRDSAPFAQPQQQPTHKTEEISPNKWITDESRDLVLWIRHIGEQSHTIASVTLLPEGFRAAEYKKLPLSTGSTVTVHQSARSQWIQKLILLPEYAAPPPTQGLFGTISIKLFSKTKEFQLNLPPAQAQQVLDDLLSVLPRDTDARKIVARLRGEITSPMK